MKDAATFQCHGWKRFRIFIVSLIVWMILKATTGIRVSEEAEIAGLAGSELGMEAYPEFSKS